MKKDTKAAIHFGSLNEAHIIRPSEIFAAWKHWSESVKVSLVSCKWVILDACYIGKSADQQDLEYFFHHGNKPSKSSKKSGLVAATKPSPEQDLATLIQRTEAIRGATSLFDCDDIAFYLRGRVNGHAVHRRMPFSYCFGVAVLKSEFRSNENGIHLGRPTPGDFVTPSEHALNWFVFKDRVNAKPKLKFIHIAQQSAPSGTAKPAKRHILVSTSGGHTVEVTPPAITFVDPPAIRKYLTSVELVLV